MPCDCIGTVQSCTEWEWQQCLPVDCRKGLSFTSLLGTEEQAWNCAVKLSIETCEPHFVNTVEQCAPDVPLCADEFTIVGNEELGCHPTRIYDDLFGANRIHAEQCASILTHLAVVQHRSVHYDADLHFIRTFFSDAWRVSEVNDR